MLYNIKKSFAIHHIKQNQHTIYFEEYGNPLGIPVIFYMADQVVAVMKGKKLFLTIKNIE